MALQHWKAPSLFSEGRPRGTLVGAPGRGTIYEGRAVNNVWSLDHDLTFSHGVSSADSFFFLCPDQDK